MTFDLQWYNCEIWYRLISGSAAKLLKWSWKKRHHTYWRVYTQHGDYILICMFNMYFFLTDGELNDVHVSSYQSAGQSPQISAEDHGRKVKHLYMDYTILETAEKRETTVLYSSTAYNWCMTISSQLNITMITKCFTKL